MILYCIILYYTIWFIILYIIFCRILGVRYSIGTFLRPIQLMIEGLGSWFSASDFPGVQRILSLFALSPHPGPGDVGMS